MGGKIYIEGMRAYVPESEGWSDVGGIYIKTTNDVSDLSLFSLAEVDLSSWATFQYNDFTIDNPTSEAEALNSDYYLYIVGGDVAGTGKLILYIWGIIL